MSKETYDLDDLVEDAVDVLKDLYKEDPDIDLEDSIPEVVDGVTPIYYYDIYMYAANNFWLGQQIPDIAPNECAWKQIQANIYEYVSENLYGEKMDKIRDERKCHLCDEPTTNKYCENEDCEVNQRDERGEKDD